MKRLACIGLTLLFAYSAAATEIPAVSAASVVLMDADSGRILYGQAEDEPRLIASITKLMTALVAVESGHALSEIVVIRQEWTGIEGSSLYLKPGEEIRLETLLYGLLLRSGNDAAHAVAGYCAGSIEMFVEQMNAKAESLGMENTCFANPSGLNAEEHYSTARDMAILARACLQNESLRRIMGTKSIALENRLFTNHNKLLWRYEGCIGLKTGYTQKAGRTLVSAAERDGMTLICVTLNAPDDWKDHSALFDYGFSEYQSAFLARKGDVLCRLPVSGSLVTMCEIRAKDDLRVTLAKGEKPEMRIELDCEHIAAPAQRGARVGQAVFILNGRELGRCVLELGGNIPENTVSRRFDFARYFGR